MDQFSQVAFPGVGMCAGHSLSNGIWKLPNREGGGYVGMRGSRAVVADPNMAKRVYLRRHYGYPEGVKSASVGREVYIKSI